MKLMRDVGRSCGECNACCKPFTVPEVGKHDASWCTHCRKGNGCAIYESRPLACQLWTCLWLNGKGDESQRPDLLGLMFDSEDVYLPTREVSMIHIYEMQSGALARDMSRKTIELNLEAGNMVSLHRIVDSRRYKTEILMRMKHFTLEEKDFVGSGKHKEKRKLAREEAP